MNHKPILYAILDKKRTTEPLERLNTIPGAILIQESEAKSYNENGYGIFWTVNEFDGERKKENLKKIKSWAIDIDGCVKKDVIKKLKNYLFPSLIIETKNGLHIYWDALDGTINGYREILETRLIPLFKADKKAKDVARLLRVPGYYHLKDPNNPFLIKELWRLDVAYTERQMLRNFPIQETKSIKKQISKDLKINETQNEWENIWNMDCEVALKRISGKSFVNYEIYSFKNNANGTKQIIVNDKITSCWIDQEKRIGSLDRGGPTIFQWINWYQKNKKITAEILKEEFSEIWMQKRLNKS